MDNQEFKALEPKTQDQVHKEIVHKLVEEIGDTFNDGIIGVGDRIEKHEVSQLEVIRPEQAESDLKDEWAVLDQLAQAQEVKPERAFVWAQEVEWPPEYAIASLVFPPDKGFEKGVDISSQAFVLGGLMELIGERAKQQLGLVDKQGIVGVLKMVSGRVGSSVLEQSLMMMKQVKDGATPTPTPPSSEPIEPELATDFDNILGSESESSSKQIVVEPEELVGYESLDELWDDAPVGKGGDDDWMSGGELGGESAPVPLADTSTLLAAMLEEDPGDEPRKVSEEEPGLREKPEEEPESAPVVESEVDEVIDKNAGLNDWTEEVFGENEQGSEVPGEVKVDEAEKEPEGSKKDQESTESEFDESSVRF